VQRAKAPAPPERHLANIRQLTFGGEDADGTRLVFSEPVRRKATAEMSVFVADWRD